MYLILRDLGHFFYSFNFSISIKLKSYLILLLTKIEQLIDKRGPARVYFINTYVDRDLRLAYKHFQT